MCRCHRCCCRRRLEGLPVEASMTISSMAATVDRHRQRPSGFSPFAHLQTLPLPWTWRAYFVQCVYRKRSMAVRLNPHCQVCRTPPACCLAQTPKACRPLLRLLIPFPHFEFRYPPVPSYQEIASFPSHDAHLRHVEKNETSTSKFGGLGVTIIDGLDGMVLLPHAG